MSQENFYMEGSTGLWEVVVGLEIHAQVTSQAKLFSGAATAFGADPNTQVSLVDAAMPGMLPVINKHCVEQAVKTGIGLNAKINLRSVFDRKNYFYADLPQGYQISQFLDPIVGEGHLDVELADGRTKRIGITRLHLEQDAGKSIHDQHPEKSYIDLNRSGVALMEIVSEPDIRTAEEAAAYVKKVRAIVRCLGTCDGNMDQGSMRVDVNVSVRKPGEEFGTRSETKNVNSIKFLSQTIEYEARRQIELIEDGGEIVQETRLFDSQRNITRPMRAKEFAHDYRYFPDPDLPPLVLDEAWVEGLRNNLPELPDEKKARFIKDFDLSAYDAAVIVSEMETADYFETLVQNCKKQDPKMAKLASNWMTGELFAALNKDGLEITSSPISAENLAGLLNQIQDEVISGKIAKQVFGLMWETGKDAPTLIEEKGLKQVTDTSAIERVVDDIIAANPNMVEQYKGGKDKLFGFFVGQVMKEMQGKANPGVVNKILKGKLG